MPQRTQTYERQREKRKQKGDEEVYMLCSFISSTMSLTGAGTVSGARVRGGVLFLQSETNQGPESQRTKGSAVQISRKHGLRIAFERKKGSGGKLIL